MHVDDALSIILLSLSTFSDKADKMAEIERKEKKMQEQLEREEEIRDLAIKYRRKYVYLFCLKRSLIKMHVTVFIEEMYTSQKCAFLFALSYALEEQLRKDGKKRGGCSDRLLDAMRFIVNL